MGEVVGAGLLAHVPTIMLPEETRRELNDGQGHHARRRRCEQLRKEVFETLDYDTVVVLDSHWFTTVEFVVTAQERRAGLFTSEELPRGMCRDPYDLRGDPELAHAIAAKADEHGTWITAIDDEYLPILLRHRPTCGSSSARACRTSGGSRSSVCQTADTEDNLRLGRALGDAIAESDRKVVLIASGALVAHVLAAARAARPRGGRRRAHLHAGGRAPPTASGSRGSARATTPGCWTPCRSSTGSGPRRRFGHYLMMIGALGEGDCTRHGAPVRRVRELDRHRPGAPVVRPARRRLPATAPHARRPRLRPPDAGPTCPPPAEPTRGTHDLRETRRILLDGNVVDVVRHGDELVAGDGREVGVDDARPPAAGRCPSKIICVHLNYSSPGAGDDDPLPPAPTYFHKPVIGAQRPRGAPSCGRERLQVAELRGRDRHRDRAHLPQHLPGRGGRLHPRLHHRQRLRAARLPRHRRRARCCGSRAPTRCAPVGPGLVEGWDFRDKQHPHPASTARCRQDGNTDEMKWDMHYLVADIARTITLQPGDVLLSGTPAISRTVYPGDVVEVEVEGLGTLTQPHRRAGRRRSATTCGAQPTESEEVALDGAWAATGRSGSAATKEVSELG